MKTEIIYPFQTESFFEAWNYWKAFKKEQFKFTYKPIGEQAALMAIGEDSGHNEDIAIKMIYQSIANGWRGIFPLKTNQQQNGKQQSAINSNNQLREEILSGFRG